MPQTSDMKHFCSGPSAKPDVPEKVWDNARPSLFAGQHGIKTVSSTPLGTAPSPHVVHTPVKSDGRASKPESLKLPRRVTVETCWSGVQRDAGADALEVSPETNEILEIPHGDLTPLGSPLNSADDGSRIGMFEI